MQMTVTKANVCCTKANVFERKKAQYYTHWTYSYVRKISSYVGKIRRQGDVNSLAINRLLNHRWPREIYVTAFLLFNTSSSAFSSISSIYFFFIVVGWTAKANRLRSIRISFFVIHIFFNWIQTHVWTGIYTKCIESTQIVIYR